ncbi:MAG: hypothetical protein HY048_09185 [Acidobacteria bacterium]|nr:hypothetical protein [Acidobacteriota bacterium]
MPSFDEALGFVKDSFSAEQLRTLGSPTETGQLQAYLATQPDAAVLEKMTAEDRLALVSRRAWSLVHYVRSLLAR